MSPKAFVVVNPAAGGGIGRRLWPEAARELEKRIGPFDFEETTSHGHGKILAAEAAEAGYPLVISYGGDGTIHEAANGLMETPASKRPVLGILCVGTGRDFIKSLGIPTDLKEQARIIAQSRTRSIDLGRVEYTTREGKKESRIFINIANAGLGGEVVRRVHLSRKFFGRKLAYLSSTLHSYFAWHPRTMIIKSDAANPHPRKVKARSYLVVVANGRFFGGGMPIAPEADPSDGLFDVVEVGEMNPFLVALAIPLLYLKRLSLLPAVRSFRAHKIMLRSEEPVHLDIDGEPIGSLPATFEILPKALEVKAP